MTSLSECVGHWPGRRFDPVARGSDLRENRLVDRREQAREFAEQRATLLREGRVAKALAGHLRANNFERWLLEEALGPPGRRGGCTPVRT